MGTRIRKFPRQGFSLVELLAAVGVLAVLMVLLLEVFRQSTRTWQHAQGASDTSSAARGALYLISRDLRNARISLRTPFLVNLDRSTGQGSTPTNDIYWFTSLPRSEPFVAAGGGGDIGTVGYFLVESNGLAPDGPGPPASRTFDLYRYFLSSQETYDHVRAFTPGSSTFDALFPGHGSLSQAAERIIEGVVGFSVGVMISGDEHLQLATGSDVLEFSNNPPQLVEVSLQVLDSRANQTSLATQPRTFSVRVRMPGREG